MSVFRTRELGGLASEMHRQAERGRGETQTQMLLKAFVNLPLSHCCSILEECLSSGAFLRVQEYARTIRSVEVVRAQETLCRTC